MEKKIYFNYEYPKPGNIHADQNYIKNYFHEFESALASNQFEDQRLVLENILMKILLSLLYIE